MSPSLPTIVFQAVDKLQHWVSNEKIIFDNGLQSVLFMNTCNSKNVQGQGCAKLWGCMGRFKSVHSYKVKVYCVAVWLCSSVTEHSMGCFGPPRSAPLLSPQLSGSKVLMVAAMAESLSICCGCHSFFSPLSPRPLRQQWHAAISVSTSKLEPDKCYFCHELMNNFYGRRCEVLHSYQPQRHESNGRWLKCSDYLLQHSIHTQRKKSGKRLAWKVIQQKKIKTRPKMEKVRFEKGWSNVIPWWKGSLKVPHGLCSYLLWEFLLLLTWPRPVQPGVGHLRTFSYIATTSHRQEIGVKDREG